MSEAPKGQYIFIIYNREGRRAIAQAIWKKTYQGWRLRSLASFNVDPALVEGWIAPSTVLGFVAVSDTITLPTESEAA
jgi:hypothetical protein